MALTKFQESLLILGAIKNILEPELRVIKRYIHDDDLKFTITNKMLIDLVSLLDEWKRLEKIGKNDMEVRETLKIASLAIKRVKSFKGIRLQRNTMLAHGFRDKSNDYKLTNVNNIISNPNIPKKYAEIILLAEFAVYAISIFICRHRKDYELALNNIQTNVTGVDLEGKGIDTLNEFEDEIDKLRLLLFEQDPSLENCFNGTKNNP